MHHMPVDKSVSLLHAIVLRLIHPCMLSWVCRAVRLLRGRINEVPCAFVSLCFPLSEMSSFRNESIKAFKQPQKEQEKRWRQRTSSGDVGGRLQRGPLVAWLMAVAGLGYCWSQQPRGHLHEDRILQKRDIVVNFISITWVLAGWSLMGVCIPSHKFALRSDSLDDPCARVD
jgi:hypothetical protein